ncbi:MAG: sigma-70 family RNA polymerase sigma factor [Phycisphaeraceae bacterium]
MLGYNLVVETYLASVLDGEISSFEPLVNEHQREVWSVLGVLLLDKPQAAAAAREVFEEVYGKLRQYDPKYPFKAFVRTIARQKVRDYLKQEAAKGQLPVYRAYVAKVFGDDAGAAAHLLKVNQTLEKFAATLPEFAKQLLHRRYDLGEDYERIAHAVKRPVASVRQTLRRAQTDLADQLLHQKRGDGGESRTVGEEQTLDLLDGSLPEHDRGELERLLLSKTEEVPRHIALMEVEAWLRGRWKDAKLGRAALNSVQQLLMKKRADHAAQESGLTAIAAGATQAPTAYRRPRRRNQGLPMVLFVLLGVAMALCVVGWQVWKYKLAQYQVPEQAIRVVAFDGLTHVEQNGRRYEPQVDLLLTPPAEAYTENLGSMKLRYNPGVAMKLGSNTRVTFDSTPTVGRMVKMEQGVIELEREVDAPGAVPMIVAGYAQIVPANEKTQLKVEQLDNDMRVEVMLGAATVRHQGTGESVALHLGQFALVAADMPLRARATDQTKRTADGLVALYRFHEEGGDIIHDVSQVGPPVDLMINDKGTVRWTRMAMRLVEPALIQSRGPATKVIDAIKQSGELTLEAWLMSGKADQAGPIVALSSDPKYRDFTLFQGDSSGKGTDQFSFNLRTRDSDGTGQPASMSREKTVTGELTHLVIVHDKSGATRWYINGKPSGESQQTGDLGNWAGDHPLTLANEATGDHPWLGTYRLLAIYSRALTPADVENNYDVGLLEPVPVKPAEPKPVEAKPVKMGYEEVFYLAGAGPTRTTPFTVTGKDYRIRVKLKIPEGDQQNVVVRQMDENSSRGEQLFTTNKTGMKIMPGVFGPGTYTLLLDCNVDVDWIVSIEELREMTAGHAPSPERPEFKTE